MSFSDTYDFEKSGFNIWVFFSLSPNTLLACKSVQDSGVTLLDTVDLTNGSSQNYKEKAPSLVKDCTDIRLTAAYNVSDLEAMLSMVGKPQTITIEYRAGNNRKTTKRYLYSSAVVSEYVPSDMERGVQPTASLSILISSPRTNSL